MKAQLWLGTVLAQGAIAVTAASQQGAPATPTATIAAIVARANANSVVASYSGSISMRVTTQLTQAGACQFSLRRESQVPEMPQGNSSDSILVDLSHLTLVPYVHKWATSEIWEVELRTWSGANEITGSGRTGANLVRPITRNRVDFNFHSEQTARDVAAMLSRAISQCGGREMTPRARAAMAEEQGIDPVTMQAKSMCRSTVQSQLRAPATARFESDSSMLVMRDSARSTLTVMGEVQAQNGFGGLVTNHFACRFTRAGDAWVPADRPLIY